MGRQNMDGGMVGSSIVLLQERFKKLQRLKEMREERKQQLVVVNNNNKLLVLAGHHHYSRPRGDDDHVYINGEDHLHDQAAAFKDPLALELNSSNNHVQYFRPHQDHQFLPPPAYKVAALHSFYEKRDVVDTSLRL